MRDAGLLLALAVLALASLTLGARGPISPVGPWGDAARIVILDMRLPRTIAAILAGGALGMAGAAIQTLTRNPLADPGLLGINAGAAFAIVLTIWLGGPASGAGLVIPALGGALLAATAVVALGSAAPGTLTLILAGAAVTAVLSALARAIILVDSYALDAFRHWIVGAVDGTGWPDLGPATPLIALGAALLAPLTRPLDALGLGEDAARALGIGVGPTRAAILLAVALLSAGAVLLAGPMGFAGLIAPHLARMGGADRSAALIRRAGLIGAALVVAADLAGRLILPGTVIEAGLGVALIGGPFLVWLVRRDARALA
ncbi:iron ABC transporter permease [Palleronia sp. LCG004]|uniref:FecCD family ABC transporter permease n=1 Tax=Palleronia sp. LCG004 TaxID=3079304 RepID=UPI002942D816|nr:iron ABC transporter permease [Palleronia sp. LCG004]WOI57984.1 iron ABC transporter permease [Palleronia sp. LCG004]